MQNCSSCRLKKARWASAQGFTIGRKTYCCMGCGFTGCICLPKPVRKTPPTPPSRPVRSH